MIFSMHFTVFIFKAPWGDLVGVGFAARMCVCRVDKVLAVGNYTRRLKLYSGVGIILAVRNYTRRYLFASRPSALSEAGERENFEIWVSFLGEFGIKMQIFRDIFTNSKSFHIIFLTPMGHF